MQRFVRDGSGHRILPFVSALEPVDGKQHALRSPNISGDVCCDPFHVLDVCTSGLISSVAGCLVPAILTLRIPTSGVAAPSVSAVIAHTRLTTVLVLGSSPDTPPCKIGRGLPPRSPRETTASRLPHCRENAHPVTTGRPAHSVPKVLDCRKPPPPQSLSPGARNGPARLSTAPAADGQLGLDMHSSATPPGPDEEPSLSDTMCDSEGDPAFPVVHMRALFKALAVITWR